METIYEQNQKEIIINQLMIDFGNARKYLSLEEIAQVIAKVLEDDLEIEALQKEISRITLN